MVIPPTISKRLRMLEILTSNYAERLDAAPTRPGRVDYRLKFDVATKNQAQKIFLRLQASGDRVETRVELEELAQTFANGNSPKIPVTCRNIGLPPAVP
ncbi:uncharacterized protein Z519_01077 [Cladophialophora bantiana CBS 173.52]|uniref:Uncharacterized protein n=1 Tax=Cladophialophora bantiana (strain ATCC 10958 / CBS 173.52 / CDC B-1940 / NIH 8579) TaxID=1442370 RepID=A0A0D2HVW2_CLAB1|nr:uncharacterized protein Z519_01077 [Cladophialophora bantiana CBS 173.52]KIW97493.1 hypothetical protein Z519_01077 [Cladophialophora bantiana CBS 173.52]